MRKSFYLALLAVPILLGGCDKTDNTGEEGEEKGNPSVNIITVTGITNLDPEIDAVKMVLSNEDYEGLSVQGVVKDGKFELDLSELLESIELKKVTELNYPDVKAGSEEVESVTFGVRFEAYKGSEYKGWFVNDKQSTMITYVSDDLKISGSVSETIGEYINVVNVYDCDYKKGWNMEVVAARVTDDPIGLESTYSVISGLKYTYVADINRISPQAIFGAMPRLDPSVDKLVLGKQISENLYINILSCDVKNYSFRLDWEDNEVTASNMTFIKDYPKFDGIDLGVGAENIKWLEDVSLRTRSESVTKGRVVAATEINKMSYLVYVTDDIVINGTYQEMVNDNPHFKHIFELDFKKGFNVYYRQPSGNGEMAYYYHTHDSSAIEWVHTDIYTK